MMEFPDHKCGLRLIHNEHKNVYENLAERLEDDYYEDMTAEDKMECIRTDSLWTLHWYPDTPVGFYSVNGSTLERVLELASNISK